MEAPLAAATPIRSTPMDPVDTSHLDMVAISSPDDPSINWTAAFASYRGHGAENTVVVPFSIAPGAHLGWHTDSLEETQYIIAGSGELQRDDGASPVGPGSTFVLPKDVRHDLRNTGTVPLLAIAFFSGGALTQTFDNVMRPTNSHILASPNATG
jgi:quercetin dioxygenase-like cupin family protein